MIRSVAHDFITNKNSPLLIIYPATFLNPRRNVSDGTSSHPPQKIPVLFPIEKKYLRDRLPFGRFFLRRTALSISGSDDMTGEEKSFKAREREK
jgi:hypothetical protein